MSVTPTILLIAFCLQGLIKFAVGFLVPSHTRINRIATYYHRDGRLISTYDSITLAVIVVLVALLFVTDIHGLSFITGLIVGMLLIQIFFHRFDKPLPQEQAPPESPAPPRKLMSYAIQAEPRPGLAGNRSHDGTACVGSLRPHQHAHRLGAYRRLASPGAGQIAAQTDIGRHGPTGIVSGAENGYRVHALGEGITGWSSP